MARVFGECGCHNFGKEALRLVHGACRAGGHRGRPDLAGGDAARERVTDDRRGAPAGGPLQQLAEQPASPCSPLGYPGTQPLAFGSPATFGSPGGAPHAPDLAPEGAPAPAPFGSGASLQPPTFGAPRALLQPPAAAGATSAPAQQQHWGAGQGAPPLHAVLPAPPPLRAAEAAGATAQAAGPFGRTNGAAYFRPLVAVREICNAVFGRSVHTLAHGQEPQRGVLGQACEDSGTVAWKRL